MSHLLLRHYYVSLDKATKAKQRKEILNYEDAPKSYKQIKTLQYFIKMSFLVVLDTTYSIENVYVAKQSYFHFLILLCLVYVIHIVSPSFWFY